MTARYAIDISLSQATIDMFTASSARLYAFKAVQSSDTSGLPIVWMANSKLRTNTTVQWIERYQAWTAPASAMQSTSPIAPGASIDIEVGQRAEVVCGGIDGVKAGAPGTIAVQSTTSAEYTTGISCFTGGSYPLVCAFPLSGNDLQIITPLTQVALLFASTWLPVGSLYRPVLPRDFPGFFTAALLIDMKGALANSRSVTYDRHSGWLWQHEEWGTLLAAGANLIPSLIQTFAQEK